MLFFKYYKFTENNQILRTPLMFEPKQKKSAEITVNINTSLKLITLIYLLLLHGLVKTSEKCD